MKTIEYQSNTYSLNGKKWVDSRGMVVPLVTQAALNKKYNEEIDFESIHISKVIELADGLKETRSFTYAIRAYQFVIDNSDYATIKTMLPRITSCYLATGFPNKAIDLFSTAQKRYGESIVNHVMLTSIATAFCDVGEFDQAKKCYDKASTMSGGRASIELSLVYKRIKKGK